MKIDNRIWIIATLLVAIGVAALGYVLGVAPRLAEAASADEQRAQVDATNEQYEIELATLIKDYENLAAVADELAALRLQLPPTADYEGFLSDLNEANKKTDTVLTDVAWETPLVISAAGVTGPAEGAATPEAPAVEGEIVAEEPVDGEAAPTEGEAAADPAVAVNLAPDGALVAIPIEFTIKGNLDNVQDFFGLAQGNERIFLVTGFGIDVDTKNSSIYAATIKGVFYVLVDSSATAEEVEELPEEPEPDPAATPGPSNTPSPTETPEP